MSHRLHLLLLLIFAPLFAIADIVLEPGQSMQVGGESIYCSTSNGTNSSKVDLKCVEYLHVNSHEVRPHFELFKDWLDSCRNIPIAHPLTPRSCTVVDSEINLECLDYARSIYLGISAERVMELQIACKDIVLSCPNF